MRNPEDMLDDRLLADNRAAFGKVRSKSLMSIDAADGSFGRPYGVKDVKGHRLAKETWAIPNLAPRGHLSLLYGAAGSGKSTLYQEAVASNALGRAFMEQLPFEEPQRFLVFDWENGPEMFFRTMQRLGLGARVQAEDNFVYYFEPPEVGLGTLAGRRKVWFQAQRHEATCVVFDALLDAFRGVPPTDEDAIGEAMQETKAIAIDLKVAVLIVAHSPKAAYEDGLHMLKGNAAWGQKADQTFWLHREKKSELRRLEHTKARAMSRRSSLAVELIEEGDPDIGPIHVVGRTFTTATAVREAKKGSVDARVKAYLAAHPEVRRTKMAIDLKTEGVGPTALDNSLKRLAEAGGLDRPEGERGPYSLTGTSSEVVP
jgi:hypothetical protein